MIITKPEFARYQHRNVSLFLLFLWCTASSCNSDQKNEIRSVQVGDVELHYKITGKGFPVILIHGGLADLSYWKKQDSLLSQNFQVIAYSRRYNYPNTNKLEPDHSAQVEASDLLLLMDKLKIEQAHIIGHSYGAFTALLFSLEHPERVKKLILAEPPLLRWLPDIPKGEGMMESFMENTWKPIGKAFLKNGERAGLDTTTRRWFNIPFDSIPQELRDEMFRNAKEWQALSTSSNAFPMIKYESVKNFANPTLIVSGGLNTGNMNDLIDGQLVRLLPNNKRVIIKDAGHEMFVDNPEGSNQAIIWFLKDLPNRKN